MTLEQVALYAPIVVAILAGARVLIQLSKLLAKIDMIDGRLKGMSKLPETVSGLEAKFDERSKAVDRRLEVLENSEYPDLSA